MRVQGWFVMVFRAVVIAGVAEGSMAAWTPAAPASACDAISIPEVADVLGESVSSRGGAHQQG